MKNIFKSLMLVAVAAMAFVGCSENSNDEAQPKAEKAVLEFTAGFAEDTRVAFGDREGDSIEGYYPTKWEAGDVVTVEYGGKSATCTLSNEDITNDGANAKISVEFELAVGESLPTSGHLVATVGGGDLSVQDGTDPILSLQATAQYPTNTLSFEHKYAYGKLSIEGLPNDFNIAKVEVSFEYFDAYDYAQGETYTINTSSATDIWFSTIAMDVNSFTVFATDANDVSYGKEVVIGANKLSFVAGEVSKFSVSGLESDAIAVSGDLVSAVATLGTSNADPNYHTVTFTRNDEAILKFELRTTGNDYLTLGTYTNDWSSFNGGLFDGYINYAYIDGSYMYVTDLVIDYNDTDKYIVTFSYGGINYNYTGDITGLVAPPAKEEGDEGDEPTPDDGGVNELDIIRIFPTWVGGGETQILFYYNEDISPISIDFKFSTDGKIEAGNFNLDSGLWPTYCCFNTYDMSTSMDSCDVNITDNGDGTFTFDTTFTYDDKTYHFTFTGNLS